MPAPRPAPPGSKAEPEVADPIVLADDAATAALGAKLAAVLRPGDLVTLSGDLGAGKTALARAIIRTLMADPALEVPSPTFALVQPYERRELRILHADLYRLLAERDADELGLDDPDAIILVEWPDRVPTLAAGATATIALAIPKSGEGRTALVSFGDIRTIPA
jgi:tRNA threonylcarbamoyl adenosine modification protein YjeE